MGLIFYRMFYEALGWSHLNLLPWSSLLIPNSSLAQLDVIFILNWTLHEISYEFRYNTVPGPNSACPHGDNPVAILQTGLGCDLEQNWGLSALVDI